MKFISKKLFFASLLLCLRCIQSLRCDRYEHCTRTLSSKLCQKSKCISLPYSSRLQIDGTNRTSIKQIIREVNHQKLTGRDRKSIINTVSTFFADFNPNIFIYRNVIGIDPVRRLRKFRNSPRFVNMSNFGFHLYMIRIFKSLDDMHSLYIPPPAISFSFAILGFTTEFYYPSNTSNPVFLVSDVIPGVSFKNPLFSVGATILEYDDIPIIRAARNLGAGDYAANDASKLTDGTTALTIRFFVIHKIPFKRYAKIKFIPRNSTKVSTILIPWKIYRVGRLDDAINLFGEILFSSSPPGQLSKLPVFSSVLHMSQDPKRKPIKIKKDFENVISAEIIKTSHGTIGHFRLFNFARDTDGKLVEEISRVLKLLPKNGLVIDMRKNRGGDPKLAKSINQLISSKTVPRSPITLRATSLTERLVNDKNGTGAAEFKESKVGPALKGALEAKEPFSGPAGDIFKIIASDPARSYKQVYFWPVITLVDAACYSSCDIFTSLQRDIGSSFVVNMDKTTGGGGASTIMYSQLFRQYPTVLKTKLPSGVDFTSSALRFYRVGNQSGALIEKVGVKPDVQYYRTKNDVLNDDEDLFNYLASKLKRQSA